jgi:glycosyltransferase involved in cell wall biosynthesis
MKKNQLLVIYAPFSYIVQLKEPGWDKTDLYEEIVQFYLPLLKHAEAETIPPCTIAISPLLLELWNEPDFQQQFLLYLQKEHHHSFLELFTRFNRNIADALVYLAGEEKIECIPTTASHCLLPYLATREGKETQIEYGMNVFETYFGKKPNGFWVEEGFVTEELEEILHEKGIQYTFADTRFILNDETKPFPYAFSRNIAIIPFEAKAKKKVSREMIAFSNVHVESIEAGAIPDNLFSSLQALKRPSINFSLPKQWVMQACHSSDVKIRHTIEKHFAEHWLNSATQEIYTISYEMEQVLKEYAGFVEPPIYFKMLKKWFIVSSKEWVRSLGEQQGTKQDIWESLDAHIEQFRMLCRLTSKEGMNQLIDESFPFGHLSARHIKGIQGLFKNRPVDLGKQKAGRLNILMLSWEFPPLVVGGLSRHVFDLSRTLAKQGHQVYVITTFVEGLPAYEKVHGVHVCRVLSLQPHHTDFFAWVNSLNAAMVHESLRLSRSISFNLVHAHDWLVGSAAQVIQTRLHIPLICTIHATEHGRNNGIHNALQEHVHKKEARLIDTAQAVIVCSEYMKQELLHLFYVPPNKISVFPNGIDPEMFLSTCRFNRIRKKYRLSPKEKLVFSVGRVVYEKGFQILMESAEMLRRERADVRFIIAGKGPLLHEYRMMAKEKGMEDYIQFIGYITDDERNQLLHLSDIVVFPSLYEPFGIVALEGMIVGKPTIVTDTGGLQTIIEDGVSGIIVRTGDAGHLAEQLSLLLTQEEYASYLGKNGKKRAETMFGWEHIAIKTTKLFQDEIFSFTERGRD